MAYDIGDADTRTVTWKNTAGTPTDPTTVTATLYAPNGTSTTPTPTNPSVGVYSVDVANDQAGHWRLHWVATGALAAAEWDEWDVQAAPSTRATDILTVTEAQSAISSQTTADDADLTRFISAVSLLIDEMCGPVVIRTVTDEQHDGGRSVIFLNEYPVASVTTVTEYASGTATVLTAESLTTAGTYKFDARLGNLTRRSSWTTTPFAASGVTVTYEAGRFADTLSVDAKFKEAAQIILAELWRAEKGAGNVNFGAPDLDLRPDSYLIPRRARQLLHGEFRAPAVA